MALTDSTAAGKEAEARPGSRPIVRLVDFASRGGDADDTVAKVEVTLGNAVDTIPGLLTALNPVATDDGMVHGIAMTAEGFVSHGYEYDARAKKLTLVSLPPDVSEYNNGIKLNDDAKFVAYIVIAEKTWAMVRSWPGMKEVVRTQPSDGYPSDYAVMNHTLWTGLYQYEFQYRIRSGPYLIVEGDAQRGTMKVDTVAAPE